MSAPVECRGHLLWASGVLLWRCQHTKEHVQHDGKAIPKTGQKCEACHKPMRVHSTDPGHGIIDAPTNRVYLARFGAWESLNWSQRR